MPRYAVISSNSPSCGADELGACPVYPLETSRGLNVLFLHQLRSYLTPLEDRHRPGRCTHDLCRSWQKCRKFD